MDAFTQHEVVTDVLNDVPPNLLKLTYGDVEVVPGMTLTPTQVKDPPVVSFSDCVEDAAFYTLIMNDPDAPSRRDPRFGEFHHWLVTNIPGGDVSKGDVMSEYVGSGPPKGTGLHRYVFLVYKQPDGKCDFDDLNRLTNQSAEGRRNHNIRAFCSTYKLMPVTLVAGNFYQAEWDEYVPKLHEQLSGK